ncbi:hypothetical protein BH24ACT15_BH24ACT15_34130 [soil metagenome]
MRRVLTTATVVLLLMTITPAAWACGFLIAENGAIRLSRFAALAAWEDGVEHYVTSFEFQGPAKSFGAIVPLPAEPTTVEKAGDWTLQRLKLEVDPPVFVADAAAAAADGVEEEAEVLATYEVEALDITILSGGGASVFDWAEQNGFDLGIADDAVEMLDFYADRSPIFAAVRYDLERAQDLAREEGDGTPVHFEMPLDAPWVPLKILTFDKPDEEIVEADIFLLTPERPRLLPHDGLDIAVSEPASRSLLADLRDDEASEWIPDEAWLTYIDVATPAGELTYDLAVGVNGVQPSEEAAYGVQPTDPPTEVSAPIDEAPGAQPPVEEAPVSAVRDRSPLSEQIPGGVPTILVAVLGVMVGGVALLRHRSRSTLAGWDQAR